MAFVVMSAMVLMVVMSTNYNRLCVSFESVLVLLFNIDEMSRSAFLMRCYYLVK